MDGHRRHYADWNKSETDKYYTLTLKNRNLKQTNKNTEHIETGNKLVVAKGWRCGVGRIDEGAPKVKLSL